MEMKALRLLWTIAFLIWVMKYASTLASNKKMLGNWGLVFDVLEFGAAGDGINDDTTAFMDAWSMACLVRQAVLNVPSNKTFLLMPSTFMGPCAPGLTFRILGKIIAPPDPNSWNGDGAWIRFKYVNNFKVDGNGVVDGQGHNWWVRSCKTNLSLPCTKAPTALLFLQSSYLSVAGLTIQNSPQIQLEFSQCDHAQATSLNIKAPADSPNTDGIHIEFSRNVVIQESSISTGDDCISITSGSSNALVRGIQCGPGHGISIGSLGKMNSVEHVSRITVDGAVLNGTTNGLRIKTWQGGQGNAVNISFNNVTMHDVHNPIIIDQAYCDSEEPCTNEEQSAVSIGNVVYSNIVGTSASKYAIRMLCSPTEPCRRIMLRNIYLLRVSGLPALADCQNVMDGSSQGRVIPTTCFA